MFKTIKGFMENVRKKQSSKRLYFYVAVFSIVMCLCIFFMIQSIDSPLPMLIKVSIITILFCFFCIGIYAFLSKLVMNSWLKKLPTLSSKNFLENLNNKKIEKTKIFNEHKEDQYFLVEIDYIVYKVSKDIDLLKENIIS